MKKAKLLLYRQLYKLLLFLSNRINNRYLKQYKILLGTTLLITTSACQSPKKEEEVEILCYEPAVQYEAQATLTYDSINDVICYEPALGPDEVHILADEMPEFPGGTDALLKYIQEKIIYPEKAIIEHIEGRVIVSFVVEKDGSISSAEVVRGFDVSLDEEALRIVRSMPVWKPGKRSGKEVRVKYDLPVKFSLPKENNGK